MKSFTMNESTKTTTDELKTAFPCDALGHLYDPRVRGMLPEGYPAASRIEAMAAMRIAGKGLHMLMERFAERHGLSEGRMALMFRLRKQGEVALSDLANGMTVSPRNVTGLVDNLERAGYVERVPDASDRRSVHARLTPAGIQLVDSIWEESMAQQKPVLEGFTPEELGQFRHLLLRVVMNIRKEESK
jgi:DNA-binding MarR family transcriptional regulator